MFNVSVVAETSIDRPGRIYSGQLGAELPNDFSNLDPQVWRPIHDDIELLAGSDDSAEA